MREIKFRAWDTARKKMWSAEEMGKDELGLNPDGRGFFNANSISTSLSQYMKHMIPLQFTGNHDSSGREIYEDDIVEFDANKWGDNVSNKFVVRWNEKIAGWDFGGGSPSESDYRTIIGNIRENPELLNK